MLLPTLGTLPTRERRQLIRARIVCSLDEGLEALHQLIEGHNGRCDCDDCLAYGSLAQAVLELTEANV